MRRFALIVLLMLSLVCGWLTSFLAAEPLWRRLLPGPRIEADPSGDYSLQQTHGPWLVMAATFSGEGAFKQAQELAVELRDTYRMPSYLHQVSFDLDEQPAAAYRRGGTKKSRYQRGDEVTELAVLVGDFPMVDDPEAQRVLQQIKQIEPRALSIEHREATSQNFAGWRNLKNKVLASKGRRGRRGPMGHAFMTRNPLLPKEYFVPKGVDKFVERMNQGVKYSLLKCRGKYTIRVATFRAPVKIAGAGRSLLSSSRREPADDSHALAMAAKKAHEMTMALRGLKDPWEAYEFHDRNQSIVTVGSFDEVRMRMPDQREVLKRDVQIILRTFDASVPFPVQDRRAAHELEQAKTKLLNTFAQQLGNQPQGLHPKQIATTAGDGNVMYIPFDIHPQVIDVPKRSVSGAFAWK